MKKTIAVLLVAMLVLTAAFAGGSKEKASSKPVLKVAISPDYAPYEFYAIDANGNATLAGFDVALAQFIADELGMELDIIPMDFDGILAEVQMGKVDLGISGFSPSPERADAVDFSDIYYAGTQAFICLASNASKFPTLEATNKKGFSFGAQTGSIQIGLAEENSPNADIVALTKVTDIIAEVLNGKLDGAYVETAVAENYAKNYPSLKVALDVPYDAEGNVVLIKKGNTELVNKVNAAIAKAISSGAMATFIEKAGEDASGDIFEGMLN